jgi:hypothetical protein
MITFTRLDALAVLAEISELAPDLRLGQLLAHLGFLSEDRIGESLWEIGDEQFLAILRYHRAELAGRSDDHRASPAVIDEQGAELTPGS